MIEIVDYLDVDARAAQLDLILLGNVVLLPRGFETASGQQDLLNESDALDLAKLLREKGVDARVARPADGKLPTIAEHDAFVHLPDILITAATAVATPVLLSVLGNFVYDKLIGTFTKPPVRVRVVSRSAEGAYKAITYEGPIEGLDILRETVEEVANGD